MSDTNRVGLRFAASSERAAPITLSPNELTQLRYTGAPGLGFQPQNVISNEIRSDRQIADLILVGAEAGGNINFELSALGFDRLIEGALLSTFTNTARSEGSSGAGSIASFGTNIVNVNTGDGVLYEVGHAVRIVHTDANGTIIDGVYEITGISTDALTLAAVAGAGTTVALTAALTDNANTQMIVCGAIAQTNGDISVVVSGGVATFTFAVSALFDNLMGRLTAAGSDRPLVIGQWVKFSGFTGTTANNEWVRITGVSTSANTITAVAQTGMATDAAAGQQVEVWFGDYIRNGTDAITDHQFAIERRYEDHSPVTRELFLGMTINRFQINLQPQSIATGQIEFFGFNSEIDETVGDLFSGGTPTDIAAPTTSVYNTSTNVGRVSLGADNLLADGVSADNLPLEVQISIGNNLRRRPAVGIFGAASMGAGQVNVGGNINTYFDNKDIADIILGSLSTQYNTVLTASDGRTMLIDLPAIKFDGGAPDVPGGNQDVVLNPGIQAIMSSTFGYTIHIQRVQYAR